ncbi:MAG: peptidoglycan-binding protein, partial [Burkholderiales bacterium]|nr:peptidoglycan-binding protein [Burkholderiales bacterium]
MKIKCFTYISVLSALFIAYVVADELFYQDNLTNKYIASQFESESIIKAQCSQNVRCGSVYTKQFYRDNNYNLVWSKNGQLLPLAIQCLTVLQDSYQEGLNPPDYHIVKIQTLLDYLKNHNEDNEKIAQLDILLTDAFFLYSSHVVLGRVNNKVIYPNWIITKRAVNLIDVLHQVLQSQNFKDTIDRLMPHNQEYLKLKQQLGIYQQLALKYKSWEQVPIGSKLVEGMHGDRVYRLQQRLLVSGELKHTSPSKVFEHDLLQAVVLFQQNNGLIADGVVGKTTIDTLNIPLMTRIKQIELNMDRFRYLPSDLGTQYIMVNIPSFSLKVIANDQTVLDMPVIVGSERGLQSCVLSSQITYLDINPYWYIP